MKVHCLFEQSGTFKKEFQKFGYQAEDYDILNDFGQTDHVVDLFAEIKRGYNNEHSIFDGINKNDLVMAFFPCTMFQENNALFFTGNAWQLRNSSDERKLEIVLDRHKKLHNNYEVLTMLCLIAYRKGFKLIIENPYTQPHYLNLYWCLVPSVIDKNRTEHGDFYKKPTQYWFINYEPQNNFYFENQYLREKKIITKVKGKDKQRERSMIAPEYANWFIRTHILDNEQ